MAKLPQTMVLKVQMLLMPLSSSHRKFVASLLALAASAVQSISGECFDGLSKEQACAHFETAYYDSRNGMQEADNEFAKAFQLDPTGESALGLFEKVEYFSDGIRGLTVTYPSGRHTEFTLFLQLVTNAREMRGDAIESHLVNSTPAGRLYLVALMKKFDPKRADQLLEGMKNEKTEVTYVDGCCPENMKVSDIAKQLAGEGFARLVATRRFFHANDLYVFVDRRLAIERLQEICSAKKIKNVAWSRLDRKEVLPLEFSNNIPLSNLEDSFPRATPAGKLYIAAIMWKYFPPSGEAALKSLSTDHSKVIYSDGEEKKEFLVSEIALYL
ncbi:MAG: hypothetical protein K2Y39_14075 [Candidatus Obscuribacterales bacterium]|nr:hypothetical protein [Candidatus Obscuribacterales bacterium]